MSIYQAPSNTSDIFNNRDYLSLNEVEPDSDGNDNNIDHSNFVIKNTEISVPSVTFLSNNSLQLHAYTDLERSNLNSINTNLANAFTFSSSSTTSNKDFSVSKLIFANNEEQSHAYTSDKNTNLINNTENLSQSFQFNTSFTKFNKNVKLNKIIWGEEPFDIEQNYAYTNEDREKLQNLENYEHNESNAFTVLNTLTADNLILFNGIKQKNYLSQIDEWELITMPFGPANTMLRSINNDMLLATSSSREVQINSSALRLLHPSNGSTFISTNGQTQNFAYTNKDRAQIQNNKINIENLNNSNNKYLFKLNLNSFEFSGHNIISNAHIGNHNSVKDYEISNNLNSNSVTADFFGITVTNNQSYYIVTGDFGILNFLIDINIHNNAMENIRIYLLQTQIIVKTQNNVVDPDSCHVQGHRSTNQPSILYTDFTSNHSHILKYQPSFYGKTIQIRSRVYIQSPPVGTTSMNMIATILKL